MQSHFLIITGMSGAGKTQVVRTLEDLNFFCIDNLPATLIPKFAELCRQTSEDKVALVVDIRGGRFFDKLLQVLDEMEASGQKYELLFLDPHKTDSAKNVHQAPNHCQAADHA